MSFGFLKIVGEPAVDRAIAFESQMDEAKAKAEHDEAVAKGDAPACRGGGAGTRQPRRFRGASACSPASPSTASLSAACSRSATRSAYGRMGDFSPRTTAAILALCGFVALYVVPILKYPANPPSIGNPDTIGMRTAIYFAMMLMSLGRMIAAWSVRNRLCRSMARGTRP